MITTRSGTVPMIDPGPQGFDAGSISQNTEFQKQKNRNHTP